MFVFVSIFGFLLLLSLFSPFPNAARVFRSRKKLVKICSQALFMAQMANSQIDCSHFFRSTQCACVAWQTESWYYCDLRRAAAPICKPPSPLQGLKLNGITQLGGNGATYSWDYNASNADAYSGSLEQAIAQIHAVPERDEVTFDLQRSNSLIWGKHKKKTIKKFKFLRRLSSLPIAPSSHSAINLRRVRCIASSGSTSGRCDAKMTCDKADLLYYAQADL